MIVLLFSISLTCGIVLAGSNHQTEPSYKYYTSIEVHSGDTLWDIASVYYQNNGYDDIRDYIKELKTLNHMTDDTIVSGTKLVVSYYSTEYK
jgi:LysM repeat protein